MNMLRSLRSFVRHTKLVLSAALLGALLSSPAQVQAQDDSGFTINLTPVLLIPKGDHHWGGGADPELRYTQDLGGARLSAGTRVGVYYARDLLGLTLMPTLRLSVPVGPIEPYASFGMGYGYLPKPDHADIATMSRLGIVFHFSERFGISLEGTVQKIERSDFRFPSFGSMLAFDL